MNETIAAINRRAVSTKERWPRRRAMLISINPATFRLFRVGEYRGFSAQGSQKKRTSLLSLSESKETHYRSLRLFQSSIVVPCALTSPRDSAVDARRVCLLPLGPAPRVLRYKTLYNCVPRGATELG